MKSVRMIRLVVLIALVAFTVDASPSVRPIVPMLDGRIVGGEDADISEVPYQLSLQSHGSHICGASVLSTTRALTAAHCTFGASPSSLSIRAGSSTRGSGGQVIQVASIEQHPKYQQWIIDYDVSVLILAEELELGENVAPVALHEEGAELTEGTLATVSGWGALSTGGPLSTTLQKVEVAKLTDAYCRDVYGWKFITPRLTCHGFAEGGKDFCQGDSGSPLVSGGVQVGVVSWSAGCAPPRYPGVFAKIANSEIRDHIISNL